MQSVDFSPLSLSMAYSEFNSFRNSYAFFRSAADFLGDIPDAATAQYALTRFAAKHGRPATFRETATLVGLIKTIG